MSKLLKVTALTLVLVFVSMGVALASSQPDSHLHPVRMTVEKMGPTMTADYSPISDRDGNGKGDCDRIRDCDSDCDPDRDQDRVRDGQP